MTTAVKPGPVDEAHDLRFLLLLALDVGCGWSTAGGRLTLRVGGEDRPVPDGTLDEVEGLGWLDLAGEKPRLTDRGRYWLKRWVERNVGPRWREKERERLSLPRGLFRLVKTRGGAR